MDVAEAIEILQSTGEVTLDGGTIRTRFPRGRASAIRSALAVIREHKAQALALLQAAERQEAARTFINKAGARLVCPRCWPGCPPEAEFAILVPAENDENDDNEFRASIRVLELDQFPVFPRSEPLDCIQATVGCSPRRSDTGSGVRITSWSG